MEQVDSFREKQLFVGEEGFSVPIGMLDSISDNELECRYRKIMGSLNAFASLRYILSKDELLGVSSKMRSLSRRLDIINIERLNRRKQ